MIQIGVKSEYKKNFGRLMIFYGNKTTFQIIGFNATVNCPGDSEEALQAQVRSNFIVNPRSLLIET